MESEEPVQEHLVELFARTRPECVLDVGANAGQYAQLLREHGYRGWIVSLEPVSSAFAELRSVAEGDQRWRVQRLALGARAERREISVAGVTQLSSFRAFAPYAAEELPRASAVEATEEVEVRTLGEAWAELLSGLPQDRVFLKLDTQGWDLEVLAGAGEALSRLVGLQLEAALQPVYEGAPTLPDTLERVRARGFELTGVFPVNRDSLLRLIEVDCVFINPRHPAAESWREETWARLSARFADEVRAAVPPGASFVLIDDAALGIDELDARPAIPFLERDGEYAGSPEDGAQAVAELGKQVARGVRRLALAWPSFWWLEEYAELERALAAEWRRVSESDAVIVFERLA